MRLGSKSTTVASICMGVVFSMALNGCNTNDKFIEERKNLEHISGSWKLKESFGESSFHKNINRFDLNIDKTGRTNILLSKINGEDVVMSGLLSVEGDHLVIRGDDGSLVTKYMFSPGDGKYFNVLDERYPDGYFIMERK